MSFRNFYKKICRPKLKPNEKKICNPKEGNPDNQWWTKNEPYKEREDLYYVPTIVNIQNETFMAKDLTSNNQERVYSLYELYAIDIMLKNYNIPFTKIISSKVVDIYSEPVECYPLKVLVEGNVNVD